VPERYFFEKIDSPVGELLMIADEAGLLRVLEFHDKSDRWRPLLARRFCDAEMIEKADAFGHASTMRRYFDGDIEAIEGLKVKAAGSAFQLAVWKALRQIPAGTTTSYGAIAKKLGQPEASRAVGLANGSNPIAIVVPCHRVIGADGSLTGYGGGLPRKRWLLAHEARHVGQGLFQKVKTK
jgi:methylated-DNA-[protein]-cysteine S-methyltransferase